jgi:signal transduction histidine kinase
MTPLLLPWAIVLAAVVVAVPVTVSLFARRRLVTGLSFNDREWIAGKIADIQGDLLEELKVYRADQDRLHLRLESLEEAERQRQAREVRERRAREAGHSE